MCLSRDDSSSSPLFYSISQNSYVNIMGFVLLSVIMSLLSYYLEFYCFAFLVEVNINLLVAMVMLFNYTK